MTVNSASLIYNGTVFPGAWKVVAFVTPFISKPVISSFIVKFNMATFLATVHVPKSDRNYVLSNATINNITNEIDLFLLPDAESIQFFITVERDFFRVPNAIVQISKFFVENLLLAL